MNYAELLIKLVQICKKTDSDAVVLTVYKDGGVEVSLDDDMMTKDTVESSTYKAPEIRIYDALRFIESRNGVKKNG